MEELKRITYISNFAQGLGFKDIEEIGEVSVRNNQKEGLTGSLLCFREIFYQILEGHPDQVDKCYARIIADPRHENLFVLKIEKGKMERGYQDWSMKTVILDENTDAMMRPMKNLLDSFQENHRILEKYAPLTVLKGLQQGENPLQWGFRKVSKVVMFSDIFASTTFTEVLSLDDVTVLLETYYDIINSEVSKAGGTISKLTGDGLMAYFDVEQADRAVEASRATLERLAEHRSRALYKFSPYLYAGIGLAAGNVVTGSIGSNVKRDYTLLGDAVNTAARLEGVTRKVGHGLVLGESVLAHMKDPGQFKKVGMYQPKGKAEKIAIYTLPQTSQDRTPEEIKKGIQNLR